MKEIALAGFYLTVEEWLGLDAASRAQLVAAVMQWEDPLSGAPEGARRDDDAHA